MPEKDGNAANAPGEIKSETVDLVVEYELHGVTPEMIDWWWYHIDNTERYRLWHPEDHISFEWEVPPSESGQFGTIHIVKERIGELPAQEMRIRSEDPASSPIMTTYSHVRTASTLGTNDEPATWITHEYQAEPYGTRMRSTFRLPANTPQEFIDNLRRHNIREMGRFPEFLPELYKQAVG